MAREPASDASGRVGARRSSVSLDPSRSSLRRVSARRNAPSRPPPPAARPEPASNPRNRRVVRAPRTERTGPPLLTRMWLALFAAASAVRRTTTSRAHGLSTRLRGPSSIALRLLGLGACIAGALLLGHFVQGHLKTAPAFAIDAIDIKGLARVDRAELLQAAGVDIGVNVFERSPEEVRARLLRHPWIVSAQVSRKLPSRFELVVREREPVALLVVEACGVPQRGARDDVAEDPSCEEPSSLYLVSDEAKMFKRLSGKDPVDLPIITGVTRQRFASDPDFSRRVLVDAVALMHEYQSSGLARGAPVEEIHLEANDGFSLYVGEDLTYVRLGAPPFAPKLRRMKKVFERLEREHARAEYIYLDNEQRPDRVPVRLR